MLYVRKVQHSADANRPPHDGAGDPSDGHTSNASLNSVGSFKVNTAPPQLYARSWAPSSSSGPNPNTANLQHDAATSLCELAYPVAPQDHGGALVDDEDFSPISAGSLDQLAAAASSAWTGATPPPMLPNETAPSALRSQPAVHQKQKKRAATKNGASALNRVGKKSGLYTCDLCGYNTMHRGHYNRHRTGQSGGSQGGCVAKHDMLP